MFSLRSIASLSFLWLSIFLCAPAAYGQCNAEAAKIGSLVKIDEDDGKKTPLILIHGFQGVEDGGDTAVLDDYWTAFTENYWKKDKALQAKYALYSFQYCSDRVDVSTIAAELGKLVDAELNGRANVLLAHSMGGLVATAYMADVMHADGNWKGKAGGDATILLITLATPHHGTPGANSPRTVEKYVPLLYKLFYARANRLFWESTLGKGHPAVTDSGLPNRSDLRWDNYDSKFDVRSQDTVTDLNRKLFDRNQRFKKYNDKLIAYSGHLPGSFSGVDAIEALNEMMRSGSIKSPENKHRVLDMANYFFVNGLNSNFKPTDGLVPFDSGLFCAAPPTKLTRQHKNYICPSDVKVRRFEPGAKAGLAPRSEIPDKNTMSIFYARDGFDHLDMLENVEVLKMVVTDLKNIKTAKVAATKANSR